MWADTSFAGNSSSLSTRIRTRTGVTGVAGPDEQNGQPVGTVHVAVAGPAAGEVRSLRLSGGRAEIRAGAVDAALSLLADVLTDRG